MDTARRDSRRCLMDVTEDSAIPTVPSRMTFEDQPASEIERSAALDGWVAAFEREMEQSGDFAKSTAAMTAHGCFDVRGVVERWILANPTAGVTAAPSQPAPQEPVPPRPVLEAAPRLEVADAPPEPPLVERRKAPRPEAGSTPDIAYFHSLLQGGIERAQIDEAFPAFGPVIAEAVEQFEAEAPILSDAPSAPTREDLNDEIRGMRQDLQASRKPERRRWRRD
jgi:hypothetical protein